MDYRGLPPVEGDPDSKLPAYNGYNPIIQGKHQDSQWGTNNVEYPTSAPPVYDTTAPPLSFPVKKIRPIRPYPAPGVDTMPNIYKLPAFLPPCPKNKPYCNKRKTPEQIRKEGSVGNPNTDVAMTDSSADPTLATVDSSNGAAAATTDGTATESSSAGTTVAPTDGTSVASTDGTTVVPTGGATVAPTDGTAASTDGITTSTDTTVATLPSTDTTTDNQDLTAQAVPSDDTLFGKQSRRSILHPRDFRVQMR